jgi:hypothetical protein
VVAAAKNAITNVTVTVTVTPTNVTVMMIAAIHREMSITVIAIQTIALPQLIVILRAVRTASRCDKVTMCIKVERIAVTKNMIVLRQVTTAATMNNSKQDHHRARQYDEYQEKLSTSMVSAKVQPAVEDWLPMEGGW